MKLRHFVLSILLIFSVIVVFSEENRSIIFKDINKTINALSSIGIGNLSNWKSDNSGGYMSITNYYSFGDADSKNFMQNNLALYFTGNENNKANLIELVLNINNSKNKSSSLILLSKITQNMFRVLNISLPKSLISNIESGKEAKYSQEGLNIEIVLEKSNIQTWIIRISPK